jgi:hypothetical protein
VSAIIKPFKCNLMDRQYPATLNRKHRYGAGVLTART